MRKNYRNSIASIKKFPQFTTMNVIDGQAGLIICASLIFYSLTIDNILNIIVLLILAGVSISMLTGDNSLLGNAQKTGPASNIGAAKDEVGLAYNNAMQEYYQEKYASTNGGSGTFASKLETAINEITEKGRNHSCEIAYDTSAGTITITIKNGGYKVIGTVDDSAGISWGEMKETTGIDIMPATLKLNIADASTKTGTLTATLSRISGDITWTSSSDSIATVSGSNTTATIEAKAEGTATITAKCTANGKEYSSTCKVTVTNGQVVGYDDIVKKPIDYYGKAVKNYTLTNKAADGKEYIFRIFYAGNDIDGEKRIYLKADPCDAQKLGTKEYADLSENVKTILKNQNPQWAATRLTSTWNKNEKATAWLCDPNNFTEKYKTTGELASKVKYVIGAPGVEMYAKSYNQTHPGGYTYNGTTYKNLKATYTSGTGYKYAFGTGSASDYTANNSIDNSGSEQMYCKPNTYMWLASPSAGDGSYMCIVHGDYANLHYENCSNTCSLAPLVSLSSDVQLQI